MTTPTPGFKNLHGSSTENAEARLAFAHLNGVAPAHPEGPQDSSDQTPVSPIRLPLGVLPEKPYLHGGSGPSAS